MHIFQVFSYDFILSQELYSYVSNFFFYHDLCVGGFQVGDEICVGSTFEVILGNFLSIMNMTKADTSGFNGILDATNSQATTLVSTMRKKGEGL
jgi:hypothetical protein